MKTFMLSTVILFCSECLAEERISTSDHILLPLVNQRVQVEGLAWGASAKGLGERVVLPSGVKLYLTGEEYFKKHPNGKLVRLIGRLSIKTMEPAPKGSQGYSRRFQFYSIEVESFELIEQIQNRFLTKLVEKPVLKKKTTRKKK